MTGMIRYTPNEKIAAIYENIRGRKSRTYDSIGNQIKILKELAVRKGLPILRCIG